MVSFGDDSYFGEDEDYVKWLQLKTKQFPEGFVMVEENGESIGLLEMQVREYNGYQIGYVNLFYLVPKKRGHGAGRYLYEYAIKFFKKERVKEYHLTVSPTNKQAMRFYKKIGMKEIGTEKDGRVIRMKGKIG
ncbi:GNAT family N-acetyltransferase [Bacillus capparidis]|uniref:GNAT family N-acetyltransferase n=1 Tax=Bacillus capparidis TaxID=1840411 RepID=UPI001CEF8B92|nr:GNAT family N-acetyltransferase [Bacillus capparidis]